MSTRTVYGRLVVLLAGSALTLPLAMSSASAALPTANQPAVSSETNVRDACPAPKTGHAGCLAKIVLKAGTSQLLATATPIGYGPADLQSAYALPTRRGEGQTVAVVDAFDDPKAEADLRHYRATFGLPPCTTANGCFTKIDQRGGTSYPAPNPGWALEISLDLDMVSAACPNCHILLVEADDNSFQNLAHGVDRAAASGADAISNSYGSYDIRDTKPLPNGTPIGDHYNHPGIAVTASSGDYGYGLSYPASSQYTVAVGGTSLKHAGTARGWAETAWSGAGSGCSTFNTKPAWQSEIPCPHRSVADVSAVADPNTGVAIYDTYYFTPHGWYVTGGTSASAPIIAAVYALAGNASTVDYPASLPYAHPNRLNDIKRGGNGFCTRR